MENNVKNVTRLKSFELSCHNCRQFHLCVANGGLGDAGLDGLVRRGKTVPRGTVVFRQGEPLRSLHIIRSGAVKCSVSVSDGTEQITGFHFSGDVLGLDSLGTGTCGSRATALESTSFCELSICELDDTLYKKLVALCAKELREDHRLLMMVGQKGVDARLAMFLLDISNSMQERGFSPSNYQLAMTRYDIANLLGVTPETISRTLSRFEEGGVLKVDRKSVLINDFVGLERLAYSDRLGQLAAGHC